ncbi:hypothetical protein [Paracoccus halophilus]|uniref:hypothetical protein n=1 Tax=Paracoccus halophilus TaxID=376733 RepID=UPI0011134310|nr:hypothetical protein [Paracoccus halophilus]
MAGDDMHPARWRALWLALCLERAAGAVAPAGTIPLAGFHAVASCEPLLRRTPNHVVIRIEPERLGCKALRNLAAVRAKGRDERFDPPIC